jgi:hypothetical protein
MDWKKLVHMCKGCFDDQYNIFFEKKDDTSDLAKPVK